MPTKRKNIILFGIALTLILSYFIVDAMLFDGIRSRTINDGDFEAKYFVKDDINDKPAIILIGGGQWGDYWAQEFAANDMVGLSLPYIGKANMPLLLEEIELEYFEKAIKWLVEQKEVNSDQVIIMGASRNAELALVIASTFPELVTGVIAYSPSAVSWSNTVLPNHSGEIKSTWKYKGVDIPYVPMKKLTSSDFKGNNLDYWESGLSETALVEMAAIQVERINGPILLFSGEDDQVWPSVRMANMIEKRLEENSFKYDFENHQYENAGHLISGNPEQVSSARIGSITIEGHDYSYEYGGTDEGDFKAKKDAKVKVFTFLNRIER